nr:MAG TPA: hypothetical protein [Bacteriophage sp.]
MCHTALKNKKSREDFGCPLDLHHASVHFS